MTWIALVHYDVTSKQRPESGNLLYICHRRLFEICIFKCLFYLLQSSWNCPSLNAWDWVVPTFLDILFWQPEGSNQKINSMTSYLHNELRLIFDLTCLITCLTFALFHYDVISKRNYCFNAKNRGRWKGYSMFKSMKNSNVISKV